MKNYVLLLMVIMSVLMMQGTTKDKNPSAEAELGKRLFFDPILSKDYTVSCASCHKPEYAFADTSAVSVGVQGRVGTRNTPTVMNVLLRRPFFWDGRSTTLEDQALLPIANHNEMDLPLEEAVQRLRSSPVYSEYFTNIFHSQPSEELLAAALAAFERTLETSNSSFDQWQMFDDASAVSAAAKRGFALFNTKARCVTCHFNADFTKNEFRNIGLFNARYLNDSGRVLITGDTQDLGKFKTPTLRNIALTAPYMHNGVFKSLEEVIEFYNDPQKIVPDAINRDTLLAKPLGLTAAEKSDLKAFLMSLTDRRFLTQ